MPISLAIAFSVIVGWPTVKLITTAFSRPLWRAQDELKSKLISDYGAAGEGADLARSIIEFEYEKGKGDLLNYLLPLIALPGSLLAMVTLLKRHGVGFASKENGDAIRTASMASGYPAKYHDALKTLCADWRFRQLTDRAFDLELLRFPLASALTIIAFSPAIFACLVFKGWTSATRAGKNFFEMCLNVLGSFLVFSGRHPCI